MTEKIHEICLRLAVLLNANPELKEITFTFAQSGKLDRQVLVDLALTINQFTKAVVMFEVVGKGEMKVTIMRG